MDLNILLKKYLNDGYGYSDARSKVCQDVILFKISKSPYGYISSKSSADIMSAIPS